MILDIDIGNSRVKWRSVSGGTVVSAGSATTDSITRGQGLDLSGIEGLTLARAASVADSAVTMILRRQLVERFSLDLQLAAVTRNAGGVTCAYEDLETLGVDRWLAVVAAYQQFKQALLVVDAGSAVTMDLLTLQGEHLGGYIIPGLRLMHEVLWRGTSGVKVEASGCEDLLLPGKHSQAAVNRGCLLAVAAAVEKLASQYSASIVVTGGDAELLMGALDLNMVHCPDLVLQGLAVEGIKLTLPTR